MWQQMYVLCVLVVAGNVHSYINNQDLYTYRSVSAKSSYLNYEYNRFRHQALATTSRPPVLWERNYHTHHMRTEAPLFNSHKIRHTNTRFPKMEKLLTKISDSDNNNKPVQKYSNTPSLARYTGNSRSELKKPVVHKWNTESPFRRLATTSTTTESTSLLDYDDADEESDPNDLKKASSYSLTSDDEEDTDDDEDMDEDEDNEDDDEDEGSDDWQAEEPTEEPTERSFTEYKWKHYGTRARVEESRRNQGHQNNSQLREVQEAVEHARRMNVVGACRVPRARVIRVQHAYPDAGKAYIPHCTVLHRCADDTGCCRLDTLTCAPKHTTRVDLLFYTGRPGGPYRTERLAFYNHTECHCVERTQEMMSRDAADSEADSLYPVRPGLTPRSIGETKSQPAPEPIRRCRCPELYSPNTGNAGVCRCDCEDGNRDCLRIKRGKEYFSLKDRLCIQRGECGFPACEFGGYIRHSGRCPRKQEKFEAFARIAPQ